MVETYSKDNLFKQDKEDVDVWKTSGRHSLKIIINNIIIIDYYIYYIIGK
jgi:hypothetical protein